MNSRKLNHVRGRAWCNNAFKRKEGQSGLKINALNLKLEQIL